MIDPRAMALVRRAGPSFLTFIAGTGALFAADVLIGRELPEEMVADWATLKSVMMPLAALAVFGLDQMVVREPSKWRLVRWPSLLTMAILVVAGSVLLVATGFYNRLDILVATAALMAICNLYFGLFRADLHFGWAQIARDGWKVLFLIGVLLAVWGMLFPIGTLLLIALGAGALLSVLAHALTKRPKVREIFDEVSGFPSALRVSWPFALVSIALAIATYGEVAIINALGAREIVAEYFVTILCFVSAINICNTFLSTFLGSMARQHPERTIAWYDRGIGFAKRHWYALPFAMLALPALTFLAGFIVHAILFAGHDLEIRWAILMAITAGTRLLYTFVSIIIGALGDSALITGTAVQYFALSLLFPLLAFGLGTYFLEAGTAVALAACLHWLARSAVGLKAARTVAGRYRQVEPA